MISLLPGTVYQNCSSYFSLVSSDLNLMAIISTNCPLCHKDVWQRLKLCSCTWWCAIVRNCSSHFVYASATKWNTCGVLCLAPCVHLWSTQAGAMQNIVSFAGCLQMLSCFHLHFYTQLLYKTSRLLWLADWVRAPWEKYIMSHSSPLLCGC